MRKDQQLLWRGGPTGNDHELYAVDGKHSETIAHIFPRDGKPGQFVLCTKNFGGWWGENKATYHDSEFAAQHHGREFGKEFFQQSERAHQEMTRKFELQNRLGTQWERHALPDHSQGKALRGRDKDEGHER